MTKIADKQTAKPAPGSPERRSALTRHIATAILASFCALWFAALIPMISGSRIQPGNGAPSELNAGLAEVVTLTEPLQLSSEPSISLKSGRFSAAPRSNGAARHLVLEDARFDIDLAAVPMPQSMSPNMHGSDAVGAVAFPLYAQLAALGFERVKLAGGAATLRWGHDRRIEITDLVMDFTPRRTGHVSASGAFRLQSEVVNFEIAVGPSSRLDAARFGYSGRVGTPASRGMLTATPAKVTLRSGPSIASFDGHATVTDGFAISGNMDIVLAEAPAVLRALGLDLPDHFGLGTIGLRGPMLWASGALSSENAIVRLAGQYASGAVVLRQIEGRPVVEGTLAIEKMDLAPYFAAMNPRSATEPLGTVWRETSTALPLVRHIDADVRLSARQLFAGDLPIGRGVATVTVKAGKLHADVTDLELPQGKGTLQLSTDMAGSVPAYSVRSRFETMDASWLTQPLSMFPSFRGKTIVVIDANGNGNTLGQMLTNLRGKLNLSAVEGATLPFDIEALKSHVLVPVSREKRGWGKSLADATAEEVEIKAQILDGQLRLDRATVRQQGVLTTATGTIGGPQRAIDIRLSSSPAPANKSPARATKVVTPSEQLTIVVRGTLDDPVLMPLDASTKP